MSGLSEMATATYSTKRSPAQSSSKVGASVTNLESVKFLPIMPLVIGQSGGIPQTGNEAVRGSVKDLWVTVAEYQEHTDSSTTVTQVPDIRPGDVLVVGSTDYFVRGADNWPATDNTLAYIFMTVEESR